MVKRNEFVDLDKPKITKEKQKTEPIKKSQKVKILISIFRYGEKIISALGVPSKDAWVSHKLSKDKLKPEELYNISAAMTNDDPFKKDPKYRTPISQTLDTSMNVIVIPETKVKDLKNIGNLVHIVLQTEIELFTK